MKWIIQCIFLLFKLLSKLQLRQKLVRLLAFNPPNLSYTLRELLTYNNDNLSEISVINTINESLRQNIDYSHKSSDQCILQKKNNQNSQDFKRSFLQKDKLIARRKKHKKVLINDEISKPFHSVFDQHYSYKPIQNYQLYYKPLNYSQYPPHQFKLINQNQSLFDVDSLDNISIISYILQTKNQQSIASIFLEIQSPKSDFVILFSHGNATDLGDMLDTYLDLAYQFNINLFAYDYQGYGQSTGTSSDINTLYDIEAAYTFLVRQLRFSPTKIILYGFSLGSGPTTALTSQPNYPVGGLILHSGLSSGLRILKIKMQATQYYDFYPNIDFISKIQCPILIMHGTEDQEIPYGHSVLLKQNSKQCRSFFFQGGGHNNLDTDKRFRDHYLKQLKSFISKVRIDNATISDLANENKSREINLDQHIYGKYMKNIFNEQFENLNLSQRTSTSIEGMCIKRHRSDITK